MSSRNDSLSDPSSSFSNTGVSIMALLARLVTSLFLDINIGDRCIAPTPSGSSIAAVVSLVLCFSGDAENLPVPLGVDEDTLLLPCVEKDFAFASDGFGKLTELPTPPSCCSRSNSPWPPITRELLIACACIYIRALAPPKLSALTSSPVPSPSMCNREAGKLSLSSLLDTVVPLEELPLPVK